MNYHHARAFCAIVQHGSFSRAADSLHLTQPTISSQIQALEKEVGARLLERSAQGVTITQAGKTFHPYALQMLELAARTEEAMSQLQGLSRGRLELGASSVPGHYIVPLRLVAFKQRWPAVEISLTVSNSHDVRVGVREGRFEIGLVGEKVRDERIRFEPLMTDRLVAAVRPEHPLASRGRLTLDELRTSRLITREHGSATRSTLEHALQKADQPPDSLKPYLELGSTEAVKMVVRELDAVAVLSEWTVADEVGAGRLRVLPITGLDLTRKIFLIWRAHGYLSSASEQFTELLKESPTEPASAAAGAKHGRVTRPSQEQPAPRAHLPGAPV